MKMQPVALGLTVINLLLMAFLLAEKHPATAQIYNQGINQTVRCRALHIVDSLGKVRASISVQPPVTVDGKRYPQTVLLRLIDSKGKPQVKLEAAENGSALSISDQGEGGILLRAKEGATSVKLNDSQGKERVVQP